MRRGRADGFTLVELMVVLAIVGVAATAVILTAPDPRPPLAREAESLAARLAHARAEAVLGGRPVAARLDASGYGFWTQSDGRWTAIQDAALKPRAWAPDTTLTSATPGLRVLFDETGLGEPARIELARGAERAQVEVEAAGDIQVTVTGD